MFVCSSARCSRYGVEREIEDVESTEDERLICLGCGETMLDSENFTPVES